MVVFSCDEFVDQPGRGLARAGDYGGANTERIHWRRTECGNSELIQFVGHDDSGRRGSQGIELSAHLTDDHSEIARIDADGSQVLSGRFDGAGVSALDVVGVNEESGVCAEGVQLSGERVRL